MKRILAIILAILILPPAQTASACVYSDGSNIPADLATAQAGSRCLEIAAGVFPVAPTGGVWLNATADGMEIRGQGIGRTIIQTTGVTLTSALTLIQLHGAHQRVSDLTLLIGAGYSGSAGVYGVSAYTEAWAPTIERVEIIGGYSGDGGANGGGVTTYRAWGTNQGTQGAVIRDCFIHDTFSQGIVVNSNGNLIQNNRIERITGTLLTHGMYVQGGYNTFDGNTIANVSGYSFHAWQKVQGVDGSGNVFSHNLSIDPGFQHMIVSGLVSNGTNPAIPSGKPLTRFVTIEANTFRNTGGRFAAGVVSDVPAIITENTFEDVLKAGAQTIGVNAAGSVVTNNRLTGTAGSGGTIQINAPSVVTGNSLDNPGTYQPFFGDTRGSLIANNLVR